MANQNRPFGLKATSRFGQNYTGQTSRYWIPSTDTDAYFVGDPVISADGADANGVQQVGKAAADSASWRGVLAGIEADPVNLAATTIPATKGRDYYVEVIDDPSVEFEIQDDGAVSGNLVAASVGKTATIAVAAPPGNCPVSATVLDSSSIADGGTSPLLLLGTKGGFGPYSRWRTKIRSHDLQMSRVVVPGSAATHYDGVADMYARTTPFAGIINTKVGAFSAFFSAENVGGGTISTLINNDTEWFQVIVFDQSNGTFIVAVSGFNAAPGAQNVLLLSNPISYAAGFYSAQASWDAGAGVGHLYVNDVDQLASSVFDNSDIAYLQPQADQGWSVQGSLDAGVPGPNPTIPGCHSEVWFDPTHYLDLSITANRRKFINADLTPADLGAHGELPFHGAPSNNPADWPIGYFPKGDGENKGSGGNLDPVGAPSACGSHP